MGLALVRHNTITNARVHVCEPLLGNGLISSWDQLYLTDQMANVCEKPQKCVWEWCVTKVNVGSARELTVETLCKKNGEAKVVCGL